MCASIAVDIDDTLFSFTDEAREVLSLMVDYPDYEVYSEQLKNCLYAKWDQWRTPHELCGFDDHGESLWLQCVERCHDTEAILRQRPFTGAVKVCCELVAAGHKLVYISNRATETKDATREWLNRNSFPIGELIVTSGNKEPYVTHCQYMIDDRPKNVVNFVYSHGWRTYSSKTALGYTDPKEVYTSLVRKAFVRVTDYNESLTDIPNLYLAHTWSGLRRYMVREGLLENKEAAHAV